MKAAEVVGQTDRQTVVTVLLRLLLFHCGCLGSVRGRYGGTDSAVIMEKK